MNKQRAKIIMVEGVKEFFETWKGQNGLIRQADAAKIVGLKPADITYRITSGKLTKYVINDTPFLSFHEVCLMKAEQDSPNN
ncbi:MAG: hypothetical protein MK132_20245 [Lentisphaerales bacterium]|nr:hypothetical protein [Lentisphaerales bacterium]